MELGKAIDVHPSMYKVVHPLIKGARFEKETVETKMRDLYLGMKLEDEMMKTIVPVLKFQRWNFYCRCLIRGKTQAPSLCSRQSPPTTNRYQTAPKPVQSSINFAKVSSPQNIRKPDYSTVLLKIVIINSSWIMHYTAYNFIHDRYYVD